MSELALQERPKRSPGLIAWLLGLAALLAVVGACAHSNERVSTRH